MNSFLLARISGIFALAILAALLSGCSGTRVSFSEPHEVRISDGGEVAVRCEVTYLREDEPAVTRQRWVHYSPRDVLGEFVARPLEVKGERSEKELSLYYPCVDERGAKGEVLEFDSTLPESMRTLRPAEATATVQVKRWGGTDEKRAYVVRIDGVEHVMQGPEARTVVHKNAGEKAVNGAAIVGASPVIAAMMPIALMVYAVMLALHGGGC